MGVVLKLRYMVRTSDTLSRTGHFFAGSDMEEATPESGDGSSAVSSETIVELLMCAQSGALI